MHDTHMTGWPHQDTTGQDYTGHWTGLHRALEKTHRALDRTTHGNFLRSDRWSDRFVPDTRQIHGRCMSDGSHTSFSSSCSTSPLVPLTPLVPLVPFSVGMVQSIPDSSLIRSSTPLFNCFCFCSSAVPVLVSFCRRSMASSISYKAHN